MTTQVIRRRLHSGCGEPLISHVFEMIKQQPKTSAKASAGEQRTDTLCVSGNLHPGEPEAHG